MFSAVPSASRVTTVRPALGPRHAHAAGVANDSNQLGVSEPHHGPLDDGLIDSQDLADAILRVHSFLFGECKDGKEGLPMTKGASSIDGTGDLSRSRKDSFFWYQKCIKSNGEDLD